MTTTMEERLAQATRAAIEEWETLGAPLARGYSEETKANLRGWPANGASTREVLRLAEHFIEQERLRITNEEAQRALSARRNARRDAKERMVSQMIEIREELGYSQVKMNEALDLKPGVIKNAENRGGSYGNDFIEQLLRRYRREAQLAGKATVASEA